MTYGRPAVRGALEGGITRHPRTGRHGCVVPRHFLAQMDGPISDAGTQWYVFWRLSQGAALYHDFVWNYGPLSAWFNAGLFRRFGPGMMVLADGQPGDLRGDCGAGIFGLPQGVGPAGAFAAWRCSSPSSLFRGSMPSAITITRPLTPMKARTACCCCW